ncbi:MAG: Spy/CpxP family protein refolding chaperone [Phormidesmis sp.]
MTFIFKSGNLKSLALGSVAAIALLSAPLAMTQSAQANEGRWREKFEELNLTDTQSARIESIFTDTRSQMRSVLTAEQQAAWDEAKAEGRRARRELNLSEDQRDQLRSIRESSQEDVQAVLTEQQREQLAEMRAQRGNRRGGGRR